MPKATTDSTIGNNLMMELQSEPVYKNHKANAATLKFLIKVVKYGRDHNFAFIPAKEIKETFKNSKVKYTVCLKFLTDHKIIEIDRHYVVGSKTRGYRLTDHGVDLILDAETLHLKNLLYDAETKRKNQKQASYHRNKEPLYTDDLLKYIHSSLVVYRFDQELAMKEVNNKAWSPYTRLSMVNSLMSFTSRDFVTLKYNETDNRVWNEFVGMKSELRRLFSYGDLYYRFVMDIRSCHPLFLAHYLVFKAKGRGHKGHHPLIAGDHQRTIVENLRIKERKQRQQQQEMGEIESIPTSTPIPTTTPPSNNQHIFNNYISTATITDSLSHYDGDNSDIMAELKRWNALFSHPDTDPKTVLKKELGYTRDQAKNALNRTINGGKQYQKFIRWFKIGFPLLYDVWSRTDMATVGNEISMYYETELMHDMGLYGLAQQLGLHLTYEYDGCGVMCRENDVEVLGKIQQLIVYLQNRSESLWNIRVILVVKPATGTTEKAAKAKS